MGFRYRMEKTVRVQFNRSMSIKRNHPRQRTENQQQNFHRNPSQGQIARLPLQITLPNYETPLSWIQGHDHFTSYPHKPLRISPKITFSGVPDDGCESRLFESQYHSFYSRHSGLLFADGRSPDHSVPWLDLRRALSRGP